jgi:hypothetical protein
VHLLGVHYYTHYTQHVSWPASISRLFGFPNSCTVGLNVPNICHTLFGCHNLQWQRSPFPFTGWTVQHVFVHLFLATTPSIFLSPWVCTRAHTRALGSFCGHAVHLTDLLPPMLSSLLSALLWCPVYPSGHPVALVWVPTWPHNLQQPRITNVLLSVTTEHVQSTEPCMVHHGRCKNIYPFHRACELCL